MSVMSQLKQITNNEPQWVPVLCGTDCGAHDSEAPARPRRSAIEETAGV